MLSDFLETEQDIQKFLRIRNEERYNQRDAYKTKKVMEGKLKIVKVLSENSLGNNRICCMFYSCSLE